MHDTMIFKIALVSLYLKLPCYIAISFTNILLFVHFVHYHTIYLILFSIYGTSDSVRYFMMIRNIVHLVYDNVLFNIFYTKNEYSKNELV